MVSLDQPEAALTRKVRLPTEEEPNDHAHGQWNPPRHRSGTRYPLALGIARCRRTDGHEIRLRDCTVRGLYRPYKWEGDALLLGTDRHLVRREHRYHRRAFARRQAPGAASMAGRGRAAMRLLPIWTN